MSEQKSVKPPKPSSLDRWKLPPVHAGELRGRVTNVRRSETVGPYGALLVIDFDLWIDDGVPTVPVRMSGTDYYGRITEEAVLDIPDPDPTLRPVTPWRVRASHNPEHEIIAHYPGREFAITSRGLGTTVLVILAPFLVAGVLIALIGYRLHWFG